MVTGSPEMEMNLAGMENGEKAEFQARFRHEIQELDCHLDVEATLTVMEGSYFIEARTGCRLKGRCDRCLKEVQGRVDGTVEILLRRNAAEETGEQDESLPAISPEEEACYDIFPRIRQFILLELPRKVLCSENCLGLCPGCGADLNSDECGCESDKADPRWAPLKKLMNDK